MRRAWELRTVAKRRLADLERRVAAEIPLIARTAAALVQAADAVDALEEGGFALLSERDGIPRWSRRLERGSETRGSSG